MVSTRLQSTTGGDNEGSSRGVRHGNGPHVSHELTPYSAHPSSPHPSQQYVSNTHFLDLPSDCMEKIFGYLGYKQVSQLRLVCKQMDRVCSAILNSTFQKLQTQMLHRFQDIKSKMPRRESARRNHPLACESDIIETLHMRLTLLQMSFGKHIERKHVCFFAGEILDEVNRILHYIKVTPKLARPYKVTDELFDLSTMAMEYFKERIEPTLPEIAYFGTDFLDFSSTSNKYMSLDSPPHGIGKGDESPTTTQSDDRGAPQQSNMVLRKRIRKIKQGMKRYNYQLSQMRKELRCCRGKVTDHQKQILEYATRLDEYDKKTEETNRKFSTMLQELNKCKTELQYWRSKSPLSTTCGACGTVSMPEQTEMVMLPELEPFPGPSTSSADVWTLAGQSPEQRNKRKLSAEKTTPGGPPSKKRNVLKSRNKRN
ncbi:F-box only protein 28-like [Macrosteles quadrilineatus]|uniref:F-box only protein 28-like n=1 Tax=Macrosteles quadrilineatus TaxID=74068 RepID=UPI0023E303A6|nr:F-box only protein 28-like [Macrosteles quadrilineatus]XP_054279681.1 F-box only protein 28-like [Macrosteles quadrilineatus]